MTPALRIETVERFGSFEGDPVWRGFVDLHARVFGSAYTEEMLERLSRTTRFLLLLAVENGELLGFKLGYEIDPSLFYSWTGAVREDSRQRGIGSALMRAQHEWCTERGYAKVQTKTKNRWREMLILNLWSGFEITGTYTDEAGELRIVLEKELGATGLDNMRPSYCNAK